jgi:8-amino-7-oxononanoate synthase
MLSWMDSELEERRQVGLYRKRRRIQSGQGPRIVLDGREYLNFSSNDYLNLASDPRLARAASDAARRYGTGSGASPLISGHLLPARALERTLAKWEGTESALIFSSGFAANLALVTSLAGREDAIYSDELNHASLIDGCRLSRARIHVYRHCDANHLADLLKQKRSSRRKLIVSDSVFSMDGDLAPLAELYDLARRFDALLLLDEAHATGILGRSGRGAVELIPPPADLDPDAVIRIGTLSKALGAQGGFVSGSCRLVRWLVNVARPYIFSTALAPPSAAAARRAIAIAQKEPWRRLHMQSLALCLRQRLGIQIDRVLSPILPLPAGSVRAALNLSARLKRQGILVPAIRPPSVPEGTARLRISLNAGHTIADVERFTDVLAALDMSRDAGARRGSVS